MAAGVEAVVAVVCFGLVSEALAVAEHAKEALVSVWGYGLSWGVMRIFFLVND